MCVCEYVQNKNIYIKLLHLSQSSRLCSAATTKYTNQFKLPASIFFARKSHIMKYSTSLRHQLNIKRKERHRAFMNVYIDSQCVCVLAYVGERFVCIRVKVVAQTAISNRSHHTHTPCNNLKTHSNRISCFNNVTTFRHLLKREKSTTLN